MRFKLQQKRNSNKDKMKHYCKMCGRIWNCRDECGYDFETDACEKCVMRGGLFPTAIPRYTFDKKGGGKA